MSSTANFYILPEAQRAEFLDAHRGQKTVTFKRAFFGQKEVVTGERYLWEYLDSATQDRTCLPFSGFAFIDYFFENVAASLPEPLASALASAALDEHYYAIPADLAAELADHLRSHPPAVSALTAYAAVEHPREGQEYVAALVETHDFLLHWFSRIPPLHFGVIHITF